MALASLGRSVAADHTRFLTQ